MRGFFFFGGGGGETPPFAEGLICLGNNSESRSVVSLPSRQSTSRQTHTHMCIAEDKVGIFTSVAHTSEKEVRLISVRLMAFVSSRGASPPLTQIHVYTHVHL